MSTVVPGGGFVVISQVKPQNDQGNGPEEGEVCDAPARMPKEVETFFKGEPEVLGTLQIFTGILFISIGIVMALACTPRYHLSFVAISGIGIWSGIFFIISGSLSVSASLKPTVGKVKSVLVMNIFTSLAAAAGIIMAIIDLCISLYYPRAYCGYYKNDLRCIGAFSLNVVVIYQTTSLTAPDTSKDVPPDSTAALTSPLKTQT
ncbi:membrane-spanning 4-domains subfamily A member 4A-like isoform X2 [Anomaloglossus baeobatrachus]|uniref:membrane-spanning 4-domains subfamily A member 4A-like isoform X2 n=1 Tax=Anomaloglossus baeobatrachus TaxID=238106 RepID=UPI003F4FB15D